MDQPAINSNRTSILSSIASVVYVAGTIDAHLRRRCAELTLRKGDELLHTSQRADVLALSRRTSMTLTMFKSPRPAAAVDLYDTKDHWLSRRRFRPMTHG